MRYVQVMTHYILYIIYQVSKFINSSILWLKEDDVKSQNSTVDCMRSARALKVLYTGKQRPNCPQVFRVGGGGGH